MADPNDPDFATTNRRTREAWDTNAAFWDDRMGEGNRWHRELVAPATLRLLDPRPGQRILDLACGNGLFARRLAALGAEVVACDFSQPMIERARSRTEGGEAASRIHYQVLDLTDPAQLGTLGAWGFQAAVANMALMDVATIEPLASALPALLVPGGRFVLSVSHPCFNGLGSVRVTEEEDREGSIVVTRSVRVSRYAHRTPGRGVAIEGQPVPQYYFDRSLDDLLGTFFRAGFVLDGLEEPVFEDPVEDDLAVFREVPPVLVARLRPTG